MENQPSFNRDLIIPILIGGLSVIGIIIVLLFARVLNSPAEVPMTPSETPFQYIYLGTEPAITTPLLEGSETLQPTDGLFNPTPVLATRTRSSIATPLILVTATSTTNILRTSPPNRSPTSTLSTALAPNTYDDTDSRLVYSGSWSSQTNVSGAHQGTLHVSTTISDSVTFTFTGPEIHVFYQSGPSLGIITITIDGLGAPPLSQAESATQIKEWISDILPAGTHSIVISHFAGGSVNIDSLMVPAPTATPTRTPTPTP